MSRTVSAALSTQLGNPVTSVGYLVEIVSSGKTRRWSNIGQVTWNSLTWYDVDFSIEGLNFDVEVELTAVLKIQNIAVLADEIVRASELFLDDADKLYDVPVTIYQFEREALAVADVPKIAVMAINDAAMEDELVAVSLVEKKSNAMFAPRRRINAAHGMEFALPPGSQILWEQEILILEPEDG